MTAVVEGKAIIQDYRIPGGMFARARTVRALKGVDFKVEKGKTLAIVGTVLSAVTLVGSMSIILLGLAMG